MSSVPQFGARVRATREQFTGRTIGLAGDDVFRSPASRPPAA
ncbi:hypothetical protein [Streptomyces sp. NPDC052727]